MKHIITLALVVLFAFTTYGQEAAKEKIYHPGVDAKADIENALATAQKEDKHVILQIGGNWCKWCIRFHEFAQQDSSVNEVLNDNFVLYHLNYSKKDKNLDLLEKYEFPQRFGFPVFVILDSNGNRLHTQDSWMLENGKDGYSSEMVTHFLKSWTPKAIDPDSYKKKKK